MHQATDRIAQQNASVYSVQPYFLDGVISFRVQLFNVSEGFNLNASTTIAADSIGSDPEPNLVLVPQNMKSRVLKSAEETAMIVAITFNSDDTIAYYVQLNNGTIVKLYGDKYVHHIDLIDPNGPAILSIIPSHTISHSKRDTWHWYEGETASMPAVPSTRAARGIEGVSSHTAIFSEGTCSSMTCLRNGGKPAMFNPFLKTCYCQTLAAPESSSITQAPRSQPEVGEGPVLHGLDNSPPRSARQIAKPSSETCRHLIACQHASVPYFDEGSSQCLCVVYRMGIKEPVITSDTTMLPRAEQMAGQMADDNLEDDNHAIVRGRAPASMLSESFCSYEFAKEHCHGKTVGRWNKNHTSCVCVQFNVVEFAMDMQAASETPADSEAAPFVEKREQWYLRCSDNLHECLSEPHHYRCDSNRNMIKHQQSDSCDKNCECSGLNLAGCLDRRGGCSWTRPDHPGTDQQNREARPEVYDDEDMEV